MEKDRFTSLKIEWSWENNVISWNWTPHFSWTNEKRVPQNHDQTRMDEFIEKAALDELLEIAEEMADCIGCDEMDPCDDHYENTCDHHKTYLKFESFKKKLGRGE